VVVQDYFGNLKPPPMKVVFYQDSCGHWHGFGGCRQSGSSNLSTTKLNRSLETASCLSGLTHQRSLMPARQSIREMAGLLSIV